MTHMYRLNGTFGITIKAPLPPPAYYVKCMNSSSACPHKQYRVSERKQSMKFPFPFHFISLEAAQPVPPSSVTSSIFCCPRSEMPRSYIIYKEDKEHNGTQTHWRKAFISELHSRSTIESGSVLRTCSFIKGVSYHSPNSDGKLQRIQNTIYYFANSIFVYSYIRVLTNLALGFESTWHGILLRKILKDIQKLLVFKNSYLQSRVSKEWHAECML